MKLKKLHKQKFLLSGLFVILFFSTFLYIPINANSDDDENDVDDDDDGDGVDNEEEEINERELHIEVDDYEASIESQLKSGYTQNEITIEIEVENEEEEYGLEFMFEYDREINSSEIELKFMIVVDEIIEFVDLNSNGIYEESVDQIVKIYKLNNFLPFDYQIDTVDTTTIYSLIAETTDGVFKAQTYIIGEFSLIDGILVAPTEVKIDIGIHNFNYTDLNSQLALKVKLESEKEVEYEEDEETEDEEEGRASNERGIQIIDTDYTGFFSWIENVTIDGMVYPVKITPLVTEENEEEEETKLYLNYPRGIEIIHDPKIGVEGILKEAGVLGIKPWLVFPDLDRNELLIVSAITLVGLCSLVMIFRKKRRV